MELLKNFINNIRSVNSSKTASTHFLFSDFDVLAAEAIFEQMFELHSRISSSVCLFFERQQNTFSEKRGRFPFFIAIGRFRTDTRTLVSAKKSGRARILRIPELWPTQAQPILKDKNVSTFFFPFATITGLIN
ncbi:MAG: hypothetical protein GY795_03300 [Desulfobacterales bacterium]|nr:hypothetical protein [Desulfobacterales bacterium]